MRTYFNDTRDWFMNKRFGLFVHWGIYAVGALHEQHQFRLGMARAEYAPFMKQFNPKRFDPDTWLDIMQEAGMEYLTFTTKHIDGFCMWDTKATDYNVMHTPYGKDILRMVADACHRRDIPPCLYYSVADMHHPNYPNAGRSYELSAPEKGDTPDEEKYMDFVKAQVRELCTDYGAIHGFWWDAHMFGRKDPSVNAMIRSLQPFAVIDGRGFDEGDFATPERDWDESVHSMRSFTRPIEACQSVGKQSWDYRDYEDFYSDRHLIASMDNMFAKGGNYLLNVGPNADGVITQEYADIVRRTGAWYRRVREAFEDTKVMPLNDDTNIMITRRGNTLYVHLIRPPETNAVILRPLDVMPKSARILNTGEAASVRIELLPWHHKDKKPYLRIADLPVNEHANTVLVVRLDLDTLPEKIETIAAENIVA